MLGVGASAPPSRQGYEPNRAEWNAASAQQFSIASPRDRHDPDDVVVIRDDGMSPTSAIEIVQQFQAL
eukprot:9066737-Prorocentrum_lima.AAC.1